jgi:creatinine amidohydrolase
MSSYKNFSWKDIESTSNKTVLIPVGSLEQHGPHLPLGTDSIIAEELANKAGEILNIPVMPTIPIGFSEEHKDFPGTVYVSESRLKDYIEDVCRSLADTGFSNIIIVNGHGGNCNILEKLCKELSKQLKIRISTVENFQLISNENCQVHADEMETSLILFLRPDLVRKDKIVDEFPRRFEQNFKGLLNWRKYTTSGVVGYPTKGNSEKGRKYFDLMVKNLVSFVEGLVKD